MGLRDYGIMGFWDFGVKGLSPVLSSQEAVLRGAAAAGGGRWLAVLGGEE